MQWDITHDTSGNISMKSLFAPFSARWVGNELARSEGAVPWRLIPAERKFYYLTTNIHPVSRNPRVPAAQLSSFPSFAPGSTATLKEGDEWQMWEFVPI